MELYRENFRSLPVPSQKAKACQILHVALSSEPLPREPKKKHWGQIWPCPGGHNFYMELYRENYRNLPVPSCKAKACQILHVAIFIGPLPRLPKFKYEVKFGPGPGVTSFTWAYMGKIAKSPCI